jgi:tetratricopeptide (TPR) repeat protein
MKTKEIVLIDVVKKLGFEGYKALSNWVRDIIKSKEDFNKFIDQQDDSYNRPEKIIVKGEARTLIDNLCILKPYMRLFEKVTVTDESNHFSAYRQLKSSSKSGLKTRSEKLKIDLELKKKGIEEALIQLPKVTAVLCSNNPIDITTDSLRELIEKACPPSEVVDFAKSFQIAAWNELSTLEAQLDKDETSETYRKVAEKILELEDEDGALEALDNATTISPDDGIAWALKAKIYLDLLGKAHKEKMTALSVSDFSGGFEHPINSEEQWINERIDDAYFSTENLHALFVEACLFALEYCPCWDNSVHTDKNGVQRKNFKPKYTSEISRDWIFFHLILNLKKSDIEKYDIRLLEILRTFQSPYEAMPKLIFSPFSAEYQNETRFQLKLIEILSWISLDDCHQLLNVFVERFESWGWQWRSAEDVAILSRSNISQLFWDYLGREKFLRLYEKLESHVTKSRQMEKLETLCSIQWRLLLSGFNDDLKNLMVQDFLSFHMNLEIKQELDEKWQVFIEQSYDKITGWHELWDDYILSDCYRFNDTTTYLFFVCPLIELQHNKPTDIGIKILCKFSESQGALQKVAAMDEHLLDRLIQPVLGNLSKLIIPQKQEVQKNLELVLEECERMRDV